MIQAQTAQPHVTQPHRSLNPDPSTTLSSFSRSCFDRRYAAGEVIFQAFDPATDLHIIRRGQIKLVTQTSDGYERILAVLGEGDLIGAAFLLQTAQHGSTQHHVDAVALTETTTCPVSYEQFVRVTREQPQAILIFAQTLVSQLFQSWDQLGHSYAPVKQRLARALLEHTLRFGTPFDRTWYKLDTPLNHADLASMVTATRVSVSTAIAALRQVGVLRGTRGVYEVDTAALRKVAEE